MIEKAKHMGSSLTGLIGVVWSLHVLLAAALFPSPLLPKDDDEQGKNIYRLSSFICGTLFLVVNVLALIAFFTRSSLVDAAKVLFVLLIWFLMAFIFVLFNHLRDIHQLFSLLEEEAIQGRDQSVMLIRAGQAALQAGNRKLALQTGEQSSFSDLLRKVGPLALLFLRREKSLVQIGLEMGKVLVFGSRWFNNLF